MKYRTFWRLVLLALPVLMAACTSVRPLSADAFEHIREHRLNYTKSELNAKLVGFLTNRYQMINIQVNEGGVISGTYHVEVGRESGAHVTGEFAFIMKYEDGSVREKLFIKRAYVGTLVDYPAKYWGNWQDGIFEEYREFDSSLVEYMASMSSF